MKRKVHPQPSFDERPCRGASLVELVAVMAIVVILTSLYWRSNAGSRAARQKAACQQNLERIFMAMEIYANDSGGRFPVVSGAPTAEAALRPLVPRYTVDTSLFLCPASGDEPALAGAKEFPSSYAYYMGRKSGDPSVLLSDRQIDALAKAAGQTVFSSTGKPPANNHGKAGGNFLFCDGHVQSVTFQTPVGLELTNGVVLLNPGKTQ